MIKSYLIIGYALAKASDVKRLKYKFKVGDKSPLDPDSKVKEFWKKGDFEQGANFNVIGTNLNELIIYSLNTSLGNYCLKTLERVYI